AVEYASPTNFYTHDGKMTGFRTVDGNGGGLNWANFLTTTITSSGLTLVGPSALNVKPDNIGSAQNGWVLTLVDQPTGKSQWGVIPSAINIYNTSSSITPASTTRTVGLNSGTLTFQGPGIFNVLSASALALNSAGDLSV